MTSLLNINEDGVGKTIIDRNQYECPSITPSKNRSQLMRGWYTTENWNSESRASVSTDNLTLPCLIRRNLISSPYFTPSDVQNLKFLQFPVSQKWSVRKIHFLDPYFLCNESPTWKRRKSQMPLFFKFSFWRKPVTSRKRENLI